MNKIILLFAAAALCGTAACNNNRPAVDAVEAGCDAVEAFADGVADDDACFTVEEVFASGEAAEVAE
ncbi:MAG: hypothetical protein IJ760_01090 [Bacteroidales bacterium]|nr:hypothetical protein [Bacteroidales bacterium]